MARQLLLMRQGASKRRPEGEGLHSKAKRRAQRMGIWIVRHNLVPDCIICISTPCAIVTATKLTKAMGLSSRSIVVHHHINKALSALPQEQQRILIVA
ncbi:MAG: hypothetical protein R8J85_09285, partial [Mariprofundales bacterium]